MTYKRIVMATDGSASAETAERIAASLARTTKGSLIVVHAYQDPANAPAAVTRAAANAERLDVRSDVVTSSEHPAEAILEVANERDAELIVIGSRGLFREEQVFGNVVKKVASHAPCDVLLTRARPEGELPDGEAPYHRMLIATDGSVTADRAARKGYALAKRLGTSVTLLFVGHPKTGELILQDTVASIGAGSGVESGTAIREGDAAREIIDAVAEGGFDLAVVGNRGLAGARAALLGSVPLEVAQFAHADVLIARTIAQNLDEIGAREGGIVATGDHKVAVYRDEDGAIHTLSARCTHMGCTVKWNPTEHTWDCPCHGSRFGPTGEVVNGPAARPLEQTAL